MEASSMVEKGFLGEFEQMVLLAIAAEENDASANDIADRLERSAGRTVSRGSLYTTLDRMRRKGLVDWRIEPGDLARSGLPRRHFTVQPAGVDALRQSRAALRALWKRAAGVIGDPSG
jgi:PadR family transcriptional regulator